MRDPDVDASLEASLDASLDAPVDVAALGLATAASVVERMLELGRSATSGLRLPLPGNVDPPRAASDAGNEPGSTTDDDRTERARQARRFRADAERLVELYADWTRLLVDGAAALAEQAVGGESGRDGRESGLSAILVLGPVSAGSTTTTSAWLHVLDGPPTSPATLRATDLVAHDGATVPSSAVASLPTMLDTSVARSSREVRVTIAVPPATPPGAYHGHLLAHGLPEVALPVRLEVVA